MMTKRRSSILMGKEKTRMRYDKSPVHLDFIIYTDSTIDKTTTMRSDQTLSIIQDNDDDDDGGGSDAVRSFADFHSSLFRASSSLRIISNSSSTTTQEDDDSDVGQSDDSDNDMTDDGNDQALKNLVDGLDPRLRQKVMMGRRKGGEAADDDRLEIFKHLILQIRTV